MIILGLRKETGWRWWMRFKKPFMTYDSFGCMHNSHDITHDHTIEADVCPCDLRVNRKALYKKGFKQVGTWFPTLGPSMIIIRVLSDGKRVAHEHHQCGR